MGHVELKHENHDVCYWITPTTFKSRIISKIRLPLLKRERESITQQLIQPIIIPYYRTHKMLDHDLFRIEGLCYPLKPQTHLHLVTITRRGGVLTSHISVIDGYDTRMADIDWTSNRLCGECGLFLFELLDFCNLFTVCKSFKCCQYVDVMLFLESMSKGLRWSGLYESNK